MNSPKEKAIELVENMEVEIPYLTYPTQPQSYEVAKKCALIAVDELIYSHSQDTTDNQFYFWQEVKQEILKL